MLKEARIEIDFNGS